MRWLIIFLLIISGTCTSYAQSTSETTDLKVTANTPPPVPPPPAPPVNLENINYWEESGEYIHAYILLQKHLVASNNIKGNEQSIYDHYLTQVYGANYINSVIRKIRKLRKPAKKQANSLAEQVEPLLNGYWQLFSRGSNWGFDYYFNENYIAKLDVSSITLIEPSKTEIISFSLDENNYALSANSFEIPWGYKNQTKVMFIEPKEKSYCVFDKNESKFYRVNLGHTIVFRSDARGKLVCGNESSVYFKPSESVIIEITKEEYKAWMKESAAKRKNKS